MPWRVPKRIPIWLDLDEKIIGEQTASIIEEQDKKIAALKKEVETKNQILKYHAKELHRVATVFGVTPPEGQEDKRYLIWLLRQVIDVFVERYDLQQMELDKCLKEIAILKKIETCTEAELRQRYADLTLDLERLQEELKNNEEGTNGL